MKRIPNVGQDRVIDKLRAARPATTAHRRAAGAVDSAGPRPPRCRTPPGLSPPRTGALVDDR
jgi:hypothetical protein